MFLEDSSEDEDEVEFVPAHHKNNSYHTIEKSKSKKDKKEIIDKKETKEDKKIIKKYVSIKKYNFKPLLYH